MYYTRGSVHLKIQHTQLHNNVMWYYNVSNNMKDGTTLSARLDLRYLKLSCSASELQRAPQLCDSNRVTIC